MIFNQLKQLRESGTVIGFTASTFDLLHAGHIAMLSEAKMQCDYLVVALQNDPTLDNTRKRKPVQGIVERQLQLQAVRYVDEIIVYNTERELEDIITTIPMDVRILGAEYKNTTFTGMKVCKDKNVGIYFNERNHSFSSTDLYTQVYNSILANHTENKQDNN